MTEDDKKKLTKPEALQAIKDEVELDAVEKDLAGKSEDEVLDAVEKAGGSKASAKAMFAKQDDMLAEALKKAKERAAPKVALVPTPKADDAVLTKAEAFREMVIETELDTLEHEMEGKSEDDIMVAIEGAGGSRESAQALFAKQDALLEEARTKTKVVDIRSAKRWQDRVAFRATPWAIAASLALVLGAQAAGLLALGPTQQLNIYAGANPDASATEQRAEELRDKALHEYARRHFQNCLDLLDQAKAIDPEGDNDPPIQNIRGWSKQHLEQEKGR